ncbi:hypothetical protein CDEST_06473 [Colletotrichum destructivum]|uniref:Uncharacterized protein n=1 Tax=Colletotrichum destructivum TaxID=34406 RepID=A0AAX4IEU5_9PEZI|nr:hypothetical protein CDEST_06473 [Colletotrichum destructivum]
MVTPSATILPSCVKLGGSKLPQSQPWGYFPPRGGRQKPRLNGDIEGGPNANHRTGTSAHSAVHFGSLHHDEAAAIGKRPMAAWKAQPSRDGGLRGGPLEVR